MWGILILCMILCFSPFILWVANPEGPWIDALFRTVFFEFGLFTILFPLVVARDILISAIRFSQRIINFFIRTPLKKNFNTFLQASLPEKIRNLQNLFLIFLHQHQSCDKAKLEKDYSQATKATASFYGENNSSSNSAEKDTPSSLMNRRDFLVNTGNAALFGLSFSMTGYGLLRSQELPEIENIPIYLNNLPEAFAGFRIAQISDLHVGPYIKREYVEKTVGIVNSLGADMIAITGDMVDGSVHYLGRDMESLSDLKAPSGVFFVTGNHEYYSGVEQWINAFQYMGVKTLLNENSIIRRGKEKLIIAGVTDYREGAMVRGHRTNPLAAVKDSPVDAVKILLAHQPQSIYAASKLGIDLQISGHTHGGQYIPYTYLIKFFQPYVSGLHRHEGTLIYVNRGTGYWGPPQRTGKSGEITLFELKRSAIV